MPLTFAFLSFSKSIGVAGMPAVFLTWVLVMVGCWFSFEVLKRTWFTRSLFGIKPLATSEKQPSASE
jgi:hypothetical protein